MAGQPRHFGLCRLALLGGFLQQPARHALVSFAGGRESLVVAAAQLVQFCLVLCLPGTGSIHLLLQHQGVFGLLRLRGAGLRKLYVALTQRRPQLADLLVQHLRAQLCLRQLLPRCVGQALSVAAQPGHVVQLHANCCTPQLLHQLGDVGWQVRQCHGFGSGLDHLGLHGIDGLADCGGVTAAETLAHLAHRNHAAERLCRVRRTAHACFGEQREDGAAYGFWGGDGRTGHGWRKVVFTNDQTLR